MNETLVEQWFRQEVLAHKDLYPEHYRVEIAKNRFKYFENKFKHLGGATYGY